MPEKEQKPEKVCKPSGFLQFLPETPLNFIQTFHASTDLLGVVTVAI